jgi:hypothetical protein
MEFTVSEEQAQHSSLRWLGWETLYVLPTYICNRPNHANHLASS